MSNIFAVNKPKGPTSNQVLNKIRKIASTKKVGHAGTLDPLAEGVLVVAVGREATKQLNSIVKKEKEYIADVRLGETSTTDDNEGIKSKVYPASLRKDGVKSHKVKSLEVKKVLPQFIGKIEQVPPIYSAIKIKGQEAYKRARKGESIEMKSREVEIKEIEILKYKWPNLQIRVVCGAGTYIRSLARDIGSELGVGGYLAGLIRTRVGEFKIKEAIREEDFEKIFKVTK